MPGRSGREGTCEGQWVGTVDRKVGVITHMVSVHPTPGVAQSHGDTAVAASQGQA